MYKFVKEFKKPDKTTNTNNHSQVAYPTSIESRNEVTLNGVKNNENGQEIIRTSSDKWASRTEAATRYGSESTGPNNRKSLSANNDTRGESFLKIKSNHSFNHKNGRFFEKGEHFI